MEGNITINLKENGKCTVCCISMHGDKILFELTEGEEVELLRKIVIEIRKLSPEAVIKDQLYKFLKLT